MDDKLKRRLIGAAVLVSLAVIFVPMLVEEEPIPAPPVQGTSIPPREELTFKSQILKEEVTVPMDAPPPEPPAEPAPPVAAVIPPPEEPPPPAAQPSKAKAPDAAEKEKGKAWEKEKAPPPIAKAAPPAAVPAAAKASEPKPTPTLKTSHWVVQVGNYSTREKANAVAGVLKAKGLDAFVESMGQPPTYRVAVGPEEQRRQAEVLLPKVRSATPGDEKPFVRSWP